VDLHSPDSSIPASASGSTDSSARIPTETREVGTMRAGLKTFPPVLKEILRYSVKGLNLSMGHLLSARSFGNSGIHLIRQHSGKSPVAQAEPQILRLTSSNKIGCPFSVNIRPSKKDGGLWRVCRDNKRELTGYLRHECEPNPLLIMGIPTAVSQLSAEMLASIESLHRSGIGAAHICAHLMREFDLEYLPDRVIRTATQ